MLSSTQLKEIASEVRPIIERQLDDADRLVGFRDMVAANGGDWSALKALIKAQIKDERDDAGDGKHVRKILDKAEFSSGYADMLGWSNMNEQKFSSGKVHDEPATEPQVAPQPAQSLTEDTPGASEPDGRSGDESSVTHSPETAPASDGGAVSPAASSSTPTASVINLDDEVEKARLNAQRFKADPSQADPLCLKPALCGQYSRIRVCDTCKAAAGLPTSGDAA